MRSHKRPNWSAFALLYLLSGLFFFATPHQSAAALSAELQQALDSSKYVYIQSERKSGELGAKADQPGRLSSRLFGCIPSPPVCADTDLRLTLGFIAGLRKHFH